MKRIVIIGIGNRLMMDDGIGVYVIDSIRNALEEHGIIAITGETDFQYCFGEVRSDDLVVIIDAKHQQGEPGSIVAIPLREALKERFRICSQHEYSIFNIITFLSPDLDGFLIGIETAETGIGFGLSEALKRCFDQICSDVKTEIFKIVENGKS
jgi:hydrogenase maturation protease